MKRYLHFRKVMLGAYALFLSSQFPVLWLFVVAATSGVLGERPLLGE